MDTHDPTEGSGTTESGRLGPGTLGVHGVHRGPDRRGPVVEPIVQSSTFFGGRGETGDALLYTRYGNNPTQVALGRKLAALEGTEAALPLASGMAAMSMTLLSLVEAGDHIVASPHLYGATRALLDRELPRRGVETTYVDPSDEEGWREALRPRTRLLLMEVLTNPVLQVFDPRIPARVAREAGIPLVADLTFLSPVNLRGPEVGIDLVVHSATKYLSGHSDLIAGAVCGSEERVRRVRETARTYGPSIDPQAAFLLDRGLRTLEVRVHRHNENALALAGWLEGRPGVVRVVHPGLGSHPDHGRAAGLLHGFGGMVGLVLEGGAEAADRFCDALSLACVAPSLGGVETLISQPRLTSHTGLTAAERAHLGIPDGYLRISVGIENLQDLREDLDRGLEAARRGS